MANLRAYRDQLKFVGSLLFAIIYIPHFILFLISSKKTRELIYSDLEQLKTQIHVSLTNSLLLLFFLHNNSYYRSLFYFRIGPIKALLVNWYRPGNKYFIFSASTKIGYGFSFAHPYATVINASSIGDNFKCIHLTTIGKNDGNRPVIGNNVTCGANVTVIGNIVIGDNVIIGAGSVVVKSIPDNCVVAGVPAKIIKHLK